MMKRCSWFNRFAKASARATGRPMAFILATAVIVVWAITGPIFGFSDTWQLVINTGTTIVTFLMVFLIQNTQNRDSDAIQIKLDELIRATKGAHTALLDLEELNDEDLARIRELYEEIASKSRKAMEAGEDDTGTPFVHIENANGDHNEAHLKHSERRTASSSHKSKNAGHS
jgi:low affinity Fe/Cu permease